MKMRLEYVWTRFKIPLNEWDENNKQDKQEMKINNKQ